MTFIKPLFHIAAGAIIALLVVSCGKETVDSADIVINEVMARNHTGLMAADGKLHDWIEIANNGDNPVNLKDFSLQKDSGSAVWSFPDTLIAPKDHILVFATKKPVEGQLSCGFKLSTQKLHLLLLSPSGDTLSSVSCHHLHADQALHLNKKGKYKKTYQPTPGFKNGDKGYASCLALIERQRTDPLRISEFLYCSAPSANGTDPKRLWVELHNTSTGPIDLSHYSLVSAKKDKEPVQLPAVTLQPDARYVVTDTQKQLDGRSVALCRDGKFADGVCAADAYPGVSVGRSEGRDGYLYFAAPTPGSANTTHGCHAIAEAPTFTPQPGIYSKAHRLVLHLKTHGHTVHYTTDGSLPTASSPVYRDSIVIERTTIVRTFAEGDSLHLPSAARTGTFFLATSHNLPVVSIALNPADFYDYRTGIYVDGPGFNDEWPHQGANYWKNWTKRAHVEFYDKDSHFSEDCGLAIFGGFSRAEAKKSFKIKFKDVYGDSHLDFDLYDEGHKRRVKNFVLRSGSQDVKGVMVRDEFFTSLMAAGSPTLMVQAYRPVVLYLNGEYFGLYYIREKIDRHFVSHHLGVDNDSISILMSKAYVEEGSSADYLSLLNYAKSHDLSLAEHYKYVDQRIDLQGLIDQKLGEMYAANTDVGNVRYVRSTSKGSDRKWHLVYYDLDASWIGHIPASYYLRSGADTSDGSVSMHNVLIHHLLRNSQFRALFLQRLSHHLHHTFSAATATATYDKLVATIRPEMERNCSRWSAVMSYRTWEANVKTFRGKFADRPKVILDDLRRELSITPQEEKKYFSDLGY